MLELNVTSTGIIIIRLVNSHNQNNDILVPTLGSLEETRFGERMTVQIVKRGSSRRICTGGRQHTKTWVGEFVGS